MVFQITTLRETLHRGAAESAHRLVAGNLGYVVRHPVGYSGNPLADTIRADQPRRGQNCFIDPTIFGTRKLVSGMEQLAFARSINRTNAMDTMTSRFWRVMLSIPPSVFR